PNLHAPLSITWCLSLKPGLKPNATGHYVVIYYHKTWNEAQTYFLLRVDLATIENMEEMKRLIKTVRGTFYGSAWIGLYDDLNNWIWPLDNAAIERGFKSWFIQQPRNSGGQSLCVYMSYYQGTWGENFCMQTLPFTKCYWALCGYLLSQNLE
uniref:C-type lectin domain-containing protein n=1 Tax=Sinocyclocheilus anshuiensis TaxID=1608454 RepID=A0A671QEK9_9TELE